MKLNPEYDAIEMLANTILVAARTAPKAKGEDNIVTGLVENDEIELLVATMKTIATNKGEGFEFFNRDAQNVKNADAVILIGMKASGAAGLNCSACGFSKCVEMMQHGQIESDYIGPNCAFKLIDLGIALGSAVAKAKDMCIDNRIMYSAGTAARIAKLIDADVVCAIPLSVSGKNPFFDRQ
ncbi:MAG: ferredoxin domain-containing protein [Methanosarcinaceae archaeon]